MRNRTITSLVLVAVAVAATAACSSDDTTSTTGAAGGTTTTARASGGTTPTGDGPVGTGRTDGTNHTFDIDADRTIEASVGDTITLRLAANMTTGYSWSQTIEGDAVEEQSNEYEAPSSRAEGAGGTQVMVYRAVASGTATIELTYAQEGSGDVGERYTVTVQVA